VDTWPILQWFDLKQFLVTLYASNATIVNESNNSLIPLLPARQEDHPPLGLATRQFYTSAVLKHEYGMIKQRFVC
jgi:hypothetical protein